MRRFTQFVSLPAILAVATTVETASACSACYGDPNSEMFKGAIMGVWVMIGVVGGVLACMAGTCLFWLQRGRRFAHLTSDPRDGSTST